MNCFVIMYNRLTWPKKLCEDLVERGITPILIDNKSTYQPLLDWYERECPYRVHRMMGNYGHQVFWFRDFEEYIGDRYYMVTDHDLDISKVPNDMEAMLRKGLELFPDVLKVGLSLEISDLPDNLFTKEVKKWETKFWQTEKRNGYYLSDIDTTLAIYDSERPRGNLPNNRFFSAVRADRPYTARHMPWYNTPEFLAENEEERYYNEHTHTYWSNKYKELI